MRRMRTRMLWTALVMALCGVPAGADHHEASDEAPKAWDAERMTQLTGDLAKSMSELRTSFRQQSGAMEPRSTKRRASADMDFILRALRQSTRQLHNRVKGGAGAEETEGIARKIGSLLNDADVAGRTLMTTAWTEEKIRPAMVLINEIAPYYGSGRLYDPVSMQRLDPSPRADTPATSPGDLPGDPDRPE